MNKQPAFLGRGFGPYRKGERIRFADLPNAHFPIFAISEGEKDGIPVRNVMILSGIREHGGGRFVVDGNWTTIPTPGGFSIWDREFDDGEIDDSKIYYAIHTKGTPTKRKEYIMQIASERLIYEVPESDKLHTPGTKIYVLGYEHDGVQSPFLFSAKIVVPGKPDCDYETPTGSERYAENQARIIRESFERTGAELPY
jgi:hypothetical protein